MKRSTPKTARKGGARSRAGGIHAGGESLRYLRKPAVGRKQRSGEEPALVPKQRAQKAATRRNGGSASRMPAPERILDAAAAIFALHGYRGASLSAIAKRARVTKPLILYHFASKKRLFASLAQIAVAECERVDTEIHKPGLSAPERLRLFIDHYAELARRSPAIFAFAFEIFAKPSQASREFDTKRKGVEVFHRLAQMVSAGESRGELRAADPGVVVTTPIAVLYMQSLAVMSGAYPEIPKRTNDEVFRLLMSGLEVSHE